MTTPPPLLRERDETTATYIKRHPPRSCQRSPRRASCVKCGLRRGGEDDLRRRCSQPICTYCMLGLGMSLASIFWWGISFLFICVKRFRLGDEQKTGTRRCPKTVNRVFLCCLALRAMEKQYRGPSKYLAKVHPRGPSSLSNLKETVFFLFKPKICTYQMDLVVDMNRLAEWPKYRIFGITSQTPTIPRLDEPQGKKNRNRERYQAQIKAASLSTLHPSRQATPTST